MANIYDKYKDSNVLINIINVINDNDLYDAERELVVIRTGELIKNHII